MVKRLWHRWIESTRIRAAEKCRPHVLLYGTGFIVQHWWGFSVIHPVKMILVTRQKDEKCTPKI